MAIDNRPETALIEVLGAPGPSTEHADSLALFGQFVGSWDVEATYFHPGGATRAERRGEWHFGWVLQGRAIQDVLISPPLDDIRAGAPPAEYGTTVRFYDRRSDSWAGDPGSRRSPAAPSTSSAGRSRTGSSWRAAFRRAISAAGRSPRSPTTRSSGMATSRPTRAEHGSWTSACSSVAAAPDPARRAGRRLVGRPADLRDQVVRGLPE